MKPYMDTMIEAQKRKNVGPSKLQQMLNKVPEVTLLFWIIKVLCTTVGETFADFLNVNLNFGLTGTSIVMGVFLVIALVFQFRAKKYIPSIYWITVVFISVFGTLVTDNLTDRIGVPLETSTIFFSIILMLTFAMWYWKEKTLSIHSIFTRRREVFYWLNNSFYLCSRYSFRRFDGRGFRTWVFSDWYYSGCSDCMCSSCKATKT